MFNPDTEVLFPMRVIPTLRSLQGEGWQKLVDFMQSNSAEPADKYAFVAMLVRMCGCVGCNADSFRAMRGCTQCARQTVRRFRGGDPEILEQFRQMRKEVDAYIKKQANDGSGEKA